MNWISAGTTECRFELYERLKSRFGRGHDLKFIDGKYTASCKCTGFCTFEKHEGFISQKLMEKHNCKARDCRHFLEKPSKVRGTIKKAKNIPFGTQIVPGDNL